MPASAGDPRPSCKESSRNLRRRNRFPRRPLRRNKLGSNVPERRPRHFVSALMQQRLRCVPHFSPVNLYRVRGNCIWPTEDVPSLIDVSFWRIDMSDRDGSSFVWFLAGLGLGALAGVLYAPRSGSETREVLRARAEEGREYVRNRAREAREQAAQWADRGREVVNSQKEQFRAAYEAGRQAYHEATTETGTGKNL